MNFIRKLWRSFERIDRNCLKIYLKAFLKQISEMYFKDYQEELVLKPLALKILNSLKKSLMEFFKEYLKDSSRKFLKDFWRNF